MNFRLLTEYHSFLSSCKLFYSVIHSHISVSLRSIIHSYKLLSNKNYSSQEKSNFRLLTEYHSFLFESGYSIKEDGTVENFRLLTEYHSFLYKSWNGIGTDIPEKFPSPYGVSFILIYHRCEIG